LIERVGRITRYRFGLLAGLVDGRLEGRIGGQFGKAGLAAMATGSVATGSVATEAVAGASRRSAPDRPCGGIAALQERPLLLSTSGIQLASNEPSGTNSSIAQTGYAATPMDSRPVRLSMIRVPLKGSQSKQSIKPTNLLI